MIIKSIELENFRIYKDNNKIELSTVEGKNIYIVSGKNGFGKTTFLMSLVWCLYGRQMQEVDDLYRKEIADQGGYPKYIANSLNRKANAEGLKQFSVKITIVNAIVPELTCNEITIKRTFHLTTGEDLEILIDGFENETVRELSTDKVSSGEIFIRDYLLPIEIAKFFFFDAEKIVTLAEVNSVEQRRNLSRAYSEILGIKKYEQLKDEFEDIQKRLRSKNASKEEKGKLNLLEAEIKNLELEIHSNEHSINELRDKKDELRFESNKLQERLIRIGNTMSMEDLEQIKETERIIDSKLKQLASEIQEHMEIIPFVIAGGKLSEVAEQVSDEENYKSALFNQENVTEVSDNIITDLITEQKNFNGVITREIQNFYFDTISKLVKKHFYADLPELPSNFKSIHDFSSAEKNELDAFIQKLKASFKERFKSLTYQNNQLRNEWTQIRRRISDAEAKAEDTVIKADRETRDLLEREIVRIEKEMEILMMGIGKSKQEIENKKRLSSEITNRLKASEVNIEKDEYLTSRIQKIKKFITQFKDKKKVSLEKQILEGLQTLMHKKGFINEVKVNITDEIIDIDLVNNKTGVIPKQGLSKGEQQMYATALLHGLVAESEIEFPVFIDSPMQKFDEEHAENIIKYFYPTISDQVILFPLVNKELTQREFKMLETKIAKAFLITNIESDKSTFLETSPQEFFNTYNSLYNAD
jgi:DNA sulfur modification protein DndD